MKDETKSKGRTIESEARTSATPGQAWEAFGNEERLTDWWVDKVEGKADPGAEMVCTFESLGMRVPVKVAESVPGERLVLEWTEEAGVVVWEIDVTREGGETVVKVVCSGFGEGAAWDELYDGMKGGQPGLMKALKHYLDRHFGVPRRVVSVLRETSRPEKTAELLSAPHLTRWLAQEASLGAPGEPARIVLRDGTTLSGVVNAAAPGILDMSCDEVDGSVFLMCWQQKVWAIVQGWKLSADDARKFERDLAGALDLLLTLDGPIEPATSREIVSTRVLDVPRERVFRAWTDPVPLARWWGPNGFTNTFHEFDPRPGGTWRFVMHGPDGVDYKNRSVFLEVAKPGRIVFDHVSGPRFQMTATFDDAGGKTRVTMRMLFQTAAECERVKPIVVVANEQNFDRLTAELGRMS